MPYTKMGWKKVKSAESFQKLSLASDFEERLSRLGFHPSQIQININMPEGESTLKENLPLILFAVLAVVLLFIIGYGLAWILQLRAERRQEQINWLMRADILFSDAAGADSVYAFEQKGRLPIGFDACSGTYIAACLLQAMDTTMMHFCVYMCMHEQHIFGCIPIHSRQFAIPRRHFR
jgi:hypothetical protein